MFMALGLIFWRRAAADEAAAAFCREVEEKGRNEDINTLRFKKNIGLSGNVEIMMES